MSVRVDFSIIDNGDGLAVFKGNSKPKWFTNGIEDTSNYFKMEEDKYPYFYNLEKLSETKYRIYIQYGAFNIYWASTRFFVYEVDLTTQNVNEENNTVTVSGKTKLISVQARKTSWQQGAGVPVKYDFSLAGTNVFSYTGRTADRIENKNASSELQFNEVVGAKSQSKDTMLKISTDYTQNHYSDSAIFIGISVINDFPKIENYVPMAIRKGNLFKSLNKNKGFIKIRKSNSWVDKSKEEKSTKGQANKGKNRIRKDGVFKQQKDF